MLISIKQDAPTPSCSFDPQLSHKHVWFFLQSTITSCKTKPYYSYSLLLKMQLKGKSEEDKIAVCVKTSHCEFIDPHRGLSIIAKSTWQDQGLRFGLWKEICLSGTIQTINFKNITGVTGEVVWLHDNYAKFRSCQYHVYPEERMLPCTDKHNLLYHSATCLNFSHFTSALGSCKTKHFYLVSIRQIIGSQKAVSWIQASEICSKNNLDLPYFLAGDSEDDLIAHFKLLPHSVCLHAVYIGLKKNNKTKQVSKRTIPTKTFCQK